MRLLLIHANSPMDTLIPPNISIISAYLKQHGIEVELFDTTFYKTRDKTGDDIRTETLQVKKTDFSELGIEFYKTDMTTDFIAKVLDYEPNLIGLSAVSLTYPIGLKLLKVIEPFNILTIVGGTHATVCPEQVISEISVDMICIGEGEEALLELCLAIKNKKNYTNIKNLWVKKDGKIYKNPVRPPIDINSLPFQDWELFDKQRRYKPMGGKIRKTACIELNRGCPFSCLTEDTKIRTKNKFKNIQDIEVGEIIRAYDTENKRERDTKVTEVHKRTGKIFLVILEDGTELNISGEHPVYTKRGWVEVKDLTENDEVFKGVKN